MSTQPNQQEQAPVVLVTGSSGMIGSATIRRLCPSYQVVALDKDTPDEALPPQATFHEVDLTSDKSVSQVMQRVLAEFGDRIASVIHLAAYYDFSGEPSDLYDRVTVQGTRRLLESLKGHAVGQFVFSSTMLVHEPGEPGRHINENSPLEGRWAYPQSKIRTEELVRDRRGDIPALLLRIAGVYTDACQSIPIAHQIQRIYERRMTGHVYPGDTDRGQAFLHLDDLVEGLWQAVGKRDALPPETVPILLGEPETYSYETLQREIARLIHGDEDWNTQQIPKTVAKSGAWIQNRMPGMEDPFIKPWMIDMADDHYELSIARARQMLDWEPRHRLLDTLPRMIASLKQDPAAWYASNRLDPSSVESAS